MLRLILPLLLCQADVDEIRARIAIAIVLQQQEPAPVAAPTAKPTAKPRTYHEVYADACTKQLPLIVGVGCDVPWSPDWLTFRVEAPWHTWQQPAIVVSVPRDDAQWTIKTLPASATVVDVNRALSEWRGQRVLERLRSTVPQKYNPETQPNFQERFNRRSSLSIGRAASC